MTPETTSSLNHQLIESFWDTIPPLWHHVRSRITQQAGEEFNLTHEQFHVLRRIHCGQTNVSDLAESKHISRPAASRAVDSLVEKGLISRVQDSADRRRVILALTEEGCAVLENVFGYISKWMAEKLSVLEDEELKSIITGLEALRKAFP